MASITYQNYFRLYEKLSGMTGTADTEAYELNKTYGLEVVVLPTNKPLLRKDLPDLVYMTENQATGEDAAIEFLATKEDVWTKWVPADVAKKVKSAL